MNPRFSYVKYDESATRLQESLKAEFEKIEDILVTLPDSRPKSLCLTALEEAYMWTGKAIRDEMIKGNAIHLPERSNG